MDLSVLVPVLNRPHRVKPVAESIRATVPDAHVLFVCDPTDEQTQAEVDAAGCDMIAPGGGYASKINDGVRATDRPLLFLGADDLHFHPGWFQQACSNLSDQVHVVGVNDLCSRRVQAGVHATHFLMTREYAERPTIDGARGPLSEVYDHSFVDDELVATASVRGTLVIDRLAVVEHMHPDAGKSDWDAVYQKGRARIRNDRATFQSRMPLWT